MTYIHFFDINLNNMNYRPSDSLKTLAGQLAQLIASRDGDETRIRELLKELGTVDSTVQKKEVTTAPGNDISSSVGIWVKEKTDGNVVYRRDRARRGDWTVWSATDVLYPKGTKRRIVLLGESVARGYLYDPYYNVAKELEAILNGIPEGGNVEVVDLAKTSISLKDLLELVRSSVVLEPDLVVIFAGNNWTSTIFSLLPADSYKAILESFKELGFEGVTRFLEERVGEMIRELLMIIEAQLVKKGIPVIYIIPEFNLKDWKGDSKENALAWLPEGHIEKWVRSKEDALAATKAGDMEGLGAAAEKMVLLNPINPLGHELLGMFHLSTGEPKKARACFERSRDAVLFSGASSKPRCYKMIRDQLLLQGRGTSIEMIDLPKIFELEYPGHVPDRREFLDYCHLTVEGIKLAMRYTAQRVVRILSGKHVDIGCIPASSLLPDGHVSAIAHFSAAIHNAHSGQPAEVLQYHCKKAIQSSSKIRETMLKYVDFSIRNASSCFCVSFAELIQAGEMRQFEGAKLLLHRRGKKLLDIDLIDAIGGALKQEAPWVGEQIEQLRRREHGVTRQGVDLLESFYSRKHYNRYADEDGTGLYLARTLESSFTFILRAPVTPLRFAISCRLPMAGAAKGLIGIRLNDAADFTVKLPVSANWTMHSIEVDQTCLTAGINRLEITWPIVHRPLADGVPTTFYDIWQRVFPVVGEISSFTVSLNGTDKGAVDERRFVVEKGLAG